ncbi:hypothetical protein [Leptolyngbya sp. FACHB-321]|uniref:hypothetical protein n=1 Tax=Leptolyngbya sp. FACHB-321 TaxID=2692807 RepID=UPI001F550635|nr:hypothetical protein [Leptolyngbya sp. FACHB-321]
MKQTQPNLQESLTQSLSVVLATDRRQVNQLTVLLLLMGLGLVAIEPVLALPNPEDKPEEVLRLEVITGARSPLDGKPITASEYAQLQAELQTPGPSRPQVGRPLEKNLNLLRLRRFIKTFFPFLPVR